MKLFREFFVSLFDKDIKMVRATLKSFYEKCFKNLRRYILSNGKKIFRFRFTKKKNYFEPFLRVFEILLNNIGYIFSYSSKFSREKR